jgi:hypothetical protein
MMHGQKNIKLANVILILCFNGLKMATYGSKHLAVLPSDKR